MGDSAPRARMNDSAPRARMSDSAPRARMSDRASARSRQRQETLATATGNARMNDSALRAREATALRTLATATGRQPARMSDRKRSHEHAPLWGQ